MNLRHFDNFMLVIIMLSSISIAIEDPLDDDSKRNEVNSNLNNNQIIGSRFLAGERNKLLEIEIALVEFELSPRLHEVLYFTL